MPYQHDEAFAHGSLPAQGFVLLPSFAAVQTNGGDFVVSVTIAAHERRAAAICFSDSLALDQKQAIRRIS